METAAMAELPVEWAVVEVFGHRSHAGMIREVERFGTKMLRIDVPGEGDSIFATHFYGGAAIFSIRHCTEEYARTVAEYERPRAAVLATLPAPPEYGEAEIGEPAPDEEILF